MKIRKAKKEDFREIAEILIKESSKKPYNEKYTFEIALKEINGLAKDELYVAVNKKEIICLITYNITPDNKKKAYLGELWLKPSYQKKGIGKALVKFIEDKYKKKGIKTMRVLVKRNAGAFNFYKKIKYTEYKELVFMDKKLK